MDLQHPRPTSVQRKLHAAPARFAGIGLSYCARHRAKANEECKYHSSQAAATHPPTQPWHVRVAATCNHHVLVACPQRILPDEGGNTCRVSSEYSAACGAWCTMHGALCMVHGVQCMVYGVWCMMYNAQCMVYNTWCTVYTVHGA
jgi:hypothetical protein